MDEDVMIEQEQAYNAGYKEGYEAGFKDGRKQGMNESIHLIEENLQCTI